MIWIIKGAVQEGVHLLLGADMDLGADLILGAELILGAVVVSGAVFMIIGADLEVHSWVLVRVFIIVCIRNSSFCLVEFYYRSVVGIRDWEEEAEAEVACVCELNK